MHEDITCYKGARGHVAVQCIVESLYRVGFSLLDRLPCLRQSLHDVGGGKKLG